MFKDTSICIGCGTHHATSLVERPTTGCAFRRKATTSAAIDTYLYSSSIYPNQDALPMDAQARSQLRGCLKDRFIPISTFSRGNILKSSLEAIHNYLGQVGVAAYAATKNCIVAMARSIAADLAPRNVPVNVVAPGATKTPI